MGQKTHPYGFRLGYNKPWKSRWYADREYADLLHEDVKLRKELKERLKSAGVSSIDIERAANKLVVRIATARPGIIIGRKGAEIDKLKQEVSKRTKREVHIDIQEVHRPELDATLVAESIALQLEKRVAFRRAMRKAVDSALRFGCKGIKVRVAGRLNGAEIARKEWYLQGRLPLQTLRADIDYGTAEAQTTYGVIGVKCWIYQGENVPRRVKRKTISPQPLPRPEARENEIAELGKREQTDVDAEEGEVQKAAARPPQRQGLARRKFGVRGIRTEGHGECVDHRPPDRSVARGHHPLHQAWRQAVDPHFPGQAVHQEARGNPHGQGQRRSGKVGGGREARAHHV